MHRRCGYCRGAGHNRQTCPHISKTIPTGTENNFSPSGKRSASCSYCRRYEFKVDRTHTRSTCPIRKTARENWIEDNSSWAYKFKEDMKQAGLGIGALVQYGGEDNVYEIVDINFNDLSKDSLYGFGGKSITAADDRWVMISWIPPPTSGTWGCKVLSPIAPEIVDRQFPKDWGYGTYGVPRVLEDTKRNKRKSRR